MVTNNSIFKHQGAVGALRFILMCRVSLGFDDKVVGVVPVGQQVGGVLVVHANIVIREHPWEEVVNLSGDIQDVTHSETKETMHQFFYCFNGEELNRCCG